MTQIPHFELIVRRQKIIDNMSNNSVFIMFSAQTIIRNADVEYPFRQDSSFWYITGLNEPNSCVVLSKKNTKIEQMIYCQGRDKVKEIWTGRQLDIDEVAEITGIKNVVLFKDLEANTMQVISQILDGVECIYVDLNSNYQNIKDDIQNLISGDHRRSKSENITTIQKTSVLINPLRLIKSDWEITQLQLSSDIAIMAHQAICKRIKVENNLCENQIEADLYHSFKNQNVNWSYPAIVATGSNACTLHYIQNDQIIKNGDLVLVDAGCEYSYYASDITRCYPAGGKFSDAQKNIYNLVLKAQLGCIAELGRPNATTLSFHNKAVEILTQGLIDFGILAGNIEENINNKSYSKYFMHGTGHFLGLDVHDVGEYRKLDGTRSDTKLQAGMVLTVEPGLYFGLQDISVPEQYRGIGIRIEDNIVITPTGIINLTTNLSKTVAELENL